MQDLHRLHFAATPAKHSVVAVSGCRQAGAVACQGCDEFISADVGILSKSTVNHFVS
jgi:hypothetical protein